MTPAEVMLEALGEVTALQRLHREQLHGLGQRFADVRAGRDAPELTVLMAEVMRVAARQQRETAEACTGLVGAARALLAHRKGAPT